jgi:hypothetical protein
MTEDLRGLESGARSSKNWGLTSATGRQLWTVQSYACYALFHDSVVRHIVFAADVTRAWPGHVLQEGQTAEVLYRRIATTDGFDRVDLTRTLSRTSEATILHSDRRTVAVWSPNILSAAHLRSLRGRVDEKGERECEN